MHGNPAIIKDGRVLIREGNYKEIDEYWSAKLILQFIEVLKAETQHTRYLPDDQTEAESKA